MRKKIIAVVMVLLFEVIVGTFNVFAVDVDRTGASMIISPPIDKIMLIPGETFEGSIRVSNSAAATEDLKYSVSIGSFSLKKDENGETDYNYTDIDTVTSYNQIMDWITLGKESGTVEPNGYDIVPYTVIVPDDAPAGGQYASIVFRNRSYEDKQENEGLMVQNVVEFAVSILAEVAGDTREDGAILENSVPTLLLNNNLEATSTVRNDGNVHTEASYVLQVWPMFSDEEICTNEEEAATSLIMPGTERFHAESCSLPAIGLFRVKQTVKIFDQVSIVEKTVIVCPVWLIFIIIFIIVLIVAYFVTKSRAHKND